MIHGEGKESKHERKSSDSSREFKIRSQSVSIDKEPVYENTHERKGSDGSREFKIRSQVVNSESRHERKSSECFDSFPSP
jgi:hypothetical protein